MKYRQRFTVEGSGQFPFDMLRYDACFPASESQSVLLGVDYGGTFRRVEMERYIETRWQRPTFDRWASFTWHVIEASIETIKLP